MSEKLFFQNKKTGDVSLSKKQGFYYIIVKSKRTHNLKITIPKTQRVVVTIPASKLYVVTQRKIEKVLEEKFEFIMSAINRYQKLAEKYPELYNFSEEHYRENRQLAEELIKAKVDYYCQRYNFKYRRISIRNQSTRWGSCSAQGNLNFSYKLIFLTPEEQDYIVVHELCHLKEQNHSRNFWDLVEKIIPEYKIAHKNIRKKS